MALIDMDKFRARDRALKGGFNFDSESKNLTAIYQGEARELTRAWLKKMGQGDQKNILPFQTKLLKRMVHTAAVTYETPPTRRLEVDNTPLGADDGPQQTLLARVYQGADAKLKSADRWRTALGQAIACVSPSSDRSKKRRPQLRVFQPHFVMRDVDDGDAEDMRSDVKVAFCTRESTDPKEAEYQLWLHNDDGTWEAWVIDGAGVAKEAIYEDDGSVPFEGTPFFQIYDEDPQGQAWIPIDETRSAFALGMNVVMNELMVVLKYEAHTPMYGSGFMNKDDVPDAIGPGEFWAFENVESTINTVPLSPKLIEMMQVSKYIAESFASGENLPADFFLANRSYETGAAGKLRMQDLEKRRQDQTAAARESEVALFDAMRSVHNAYAQDWSEVQLPKDAELVVELGAPWFPVDLKELQGTYAFDLSIGSASIIDYLMDSKRIPRDQAVKLYERVQLDRARYPLRENPAAILGGQRNANGEGSATSITGGKGADVQRDSSSINPNRAASNEAGSKAGAARKGMRLAK